MRKVEQEWNEKETERLEALIQDIPTVAQVTKQFGTFENYLKALAMYHHPRHNEAMKVRNARCVPRYEDPEKAEKFGRIEEDHREALKVSRGIA